MIRVLRRWLASSPLDDAPTKLSVHARFPMSDELRAKYAAKGILIEDQPTTFKQPSVDWERLPS